MVPVPESAGVHWKTCSGELPELPQLPASELVPLVLPLKVPPCAGITVRWAQAPASVVVVVVVVLGVVVVEVVVVVVVSGAVVVVAAAGGVTLRLTGACAPPSTSTKLVCVGAAA